MQWDNHGSVPCPDVLPGGAPLQVGALLGHPCHGPDAGRHGCV